MEWSMVTAAHYPSFLLRYSFTITNRAFSGNVRPWSMLNSVKIYTFYFIYNMPIIFNLLLIAKYQQSNQYYLNACCKAIRISQQNTKFSMLANFETHISNIQILKDELKKVRNTIVATITISEKEHKIYLKLIINANEIKV